MLESFNALTPWWIRLAALYVLVGLSLSLYEERRAAGDGIVTAVGSVLLAALVAPVTAIRLAVAKFSAPPSD